MPFNFQSLEIRDIILIKPKVFPDERGYFLEMYKHSDFASAGIAEHFVQDNYSKSAKGTLRGLHFQKYPHAQGKLVYCIKGRIYDVAIDIRKDSQTFRKWIGMELSEQNPIGVYIPTGFAHGFLVLSDSAEVLYKCTDEYSPENDRGIRWNDPEINIDWPMQNPILSDKDKKHPLLKDADNNY